MSDELRSMAAMAALIRTAEWAVDNARDAHHAAKQAQVASELEYKLTMTSADNARRLTRELLGRSTFSAAMLSVATVNQAVVRDDAERAALVLRDDEQRLSDAYQELKQAGVTLRLYERLRDRNATLQQQDNRRRAQRDQDDAGATLKIYENFASNKLTEQGIADGY